MKSTFTPRDLPLALLFDGGSLIGPFCIHCGGPSVYHSATGLCPRRGNPLWPAPICTCHAVFVGDGVPKPRSQVTVRVPGQGLQVVQLNEKGQIKR